MGDLGVGLRLIPENIGFPADYVTACHTYMFCDIPRHFFIIAVGFKLSHQKFL